MYFKRGTIIWTDLSVWDMPHGKYAVTIGENDTLLGFCLINTEKSPFPAKEKFQVEVLFKNNKFLDHDSFIDCAEIFYIDKDKIDELYKNGKVKIKGQLYSNDMEKVLHYGKCDENKVLTPKKKNFFQ